MRPVLGLACLLCLLGIHRALACDLDLAVALPGPGEAGHEAAQARLRALGAAGAGCEEIARGLVREGYGLDRTGLRGADQDEAALKGRGLWRSGALDALDEDTADEDGAGDE